MTATQESFYIQQFKNGDNCAFQVLYNHHYKSILRYGRSCFPYYDDDLKDAYQDIFMSLWRGREGLNEDMVLEHYLKRSIKNHMIKIKKKELKYDKIPEDNEYTKLEYQDPSNGLETIIEKESNSIKERLFNERLKLLTKRQRFFFNERFINEKSPEEIIEEQKLARQTVYNTLHKCIKTLKTGKKQKQSFKD
jgi:RNA polymerase sigma factor (sigma-70 family)